MLASWILASLLKGVGEGGAGGGHVPPHFQKWGGGGTSGFVPPPTFGQSKCSNFTILLIFCG